MAKTSTVLAAAASAASSATLTAALAALFRVASNLWMAETSPVGLLLLPSKIKLQGYSLKTGK